MKDPLPAQGPSSERSADAGHLSHFSALDGLRGVAITVVVFHHFIPQTNLENLGPFGRAVVWVADGGWIGVDLFFVLSGFLITRILLETRGSPHYFRNFYARRALRIFPLYYAALVFALIVVPQARAALQGPQTPTFVERNQVWLWAYGTNILSANSGEHLRTRDLTLSHFWSLAIEEQFYLIWPAVVFFCRTPRRVAVVAVGFILASCAARVYFLPTLGDRAVYLLTWCRLDPLAAGALLAVATQYANVWPRVRSTARVVGVFAALGCAAITIARALGVETDAPRMGSGIPVLVALFSAGLLAHALTPGRHRLLNSAALRWAGQRSYGLYVFHAMLRSWVVWLPERLAGSLLPPAVLIPFSLVFGIAVVAILSELSFRYFESPLNALKKYFPYEQTGDRRDSAAQLREQHDLQIKRDLVT